MSDAFITKQLSASICCKINKIHSNHTNENLRADIAEILIHIPDVEMQNEIVHELEMIHNLEQVGHYRTATKQYEALKKICCDYVKAYMNATHSDKLKKSPNLAELLNCEQN